MTCLTRPPGVAKATTIEVMHTGCLLGFKAPPAADRQAVKIKPAPSGFSKAWTNQLMAQTHEKADPKFGGMIPNGAGALTFLHQLRTHVPSTGLASFLVFPFVQFELVVLFSLSNK